jgi:hypothetical protein
MSNKMFPIALCVGLVVVVVLCLLIQASFRPHADEVMMQNLVEAWCSEHTDRSDGECTPWAADMMAQHKDAIMACNSDDFEAELDCIGGLGLEP